MSKITKIGNSYTIAVIREKFDEILNTNSKDILWRSRLVRDKINELIEEVNNEPCCAKHELRLANEHIANTFENLEKFGLNNSRRISELSERNQKLKDNLVLALKSIDELGERVASLENKNQYVISDFSISPEQEDKIDVDNLEMGDWYCLKFASGAVWVVKIGNQIKSAPDELYYDIAFCMKDVSYEEGFWRDDSFYKTDIKSIKKLT